MEKVLSISIAAYNVEKYLVKALESLCNERALPFLDVIIVDDGSKDKTSDIANVFCGKYPDSFRLIKKENGGYGSTINASLDIARGKYFKLLDGDDWYNQEKLFEFVGFLSKTSADVVFSDYTTVIESDANQDLHVFGYIQEKLFDVAEINECYMHGLAVKTDILRFNFVRITENCFYTDVEFCLKAISFSATAIYYPLNLYFYRLGREGQSMSLPGLMKHIDEHDYITREALSVVYSSKLMTGLRPFVRNIARFHINYLFLYGDIKKYKAFISFLKEDYPDIKPAFKPYQLIVGMVPDLLYRPVSAIKRKKTFG